MYPRPLLTVMVLVGALSSPAVPQGTHVVLTRDAQPQGSVVVPALPADANSYVREAIRHEVAEQESDHSHWRYHLHREDDKNNVDRDVIETREGQLSRTLLMWGRPLSAEERQNDQERMQRQLSDSEERARHQKREKEDGQKAMQMLRLIPDAFLFKYEGEEKGQVRLSFVPNPHFEPPNFEAKVYRSLKGNLWVNREEMRLAGIDGTLFENVNFGWGILGHLNKGGTFRIKQEDVGEGHWDVVYEEVNMVGRAVVFKTISQKQKQARTEFRRVSDSLTLEQAYQMLQREPSASAHNQGASAVQR